MNGDLNSWDKFCNYLWFDKKLNIWLDISKINFTNEEIKNLEEKFEDVFSSIKELENGAISNIDENRQVGHYWLRNPSISPSSKIGEEIRADINSISEFGKQILNGDIKNKIINIHPSLLPAYKGGSAIKDSILNGSKITGCSVHFVEEEVDSGSLIMQAALSIRNDDDIESLTKRIQMLEHKILPQSISIAGFLIRSDFMENY